MPKKEFRVKSSGSSAKCLQSVSALRNGSCVWSFAAKTALRCIGTQRKKTGSKTAVLHIVQIDAGRKSMIGAVIGDIAGSEFELKQYMQERLRRSGSDLLRANTCNFTADTVLLISVAAALLDTSEPFADTAFENCLIDKLHFYGRQYLFRGFGEKFFLWLAAECRLPYNSLGSGSAVRAVPAAWAGKTLRQAEHLALLCARITHNHPEGIRGAQAVAGAVFLAKTGCKKAEIRQYVKKYYPGISQLNAVRPAHAYAFSCSEAVPVALSAFFSGRGFEDTLSKALSVGADSSTLAAIAGGIAEAYYGVPDALRRAALSCLDSTLREIVFRFSKG